MHNSDSDQDSVGGESSSSNGDEVLAAIGRTGTHSLSPSSVNGGSEYDEDDDINGSTESIKETENINLFYFFHCLTVQLYIGISGTTLSLNIHH